MNITITQSMNGPLSTKPYRSWALSAIHTAPSHVGQANPTNLAIDTTKERIRKLFNNVDLSVSSYDTAWVAMVPSPSSPKSPCFQSVLTG
ncbi:putative ent-kaurene synthase [Helianthus annuus]|nr:putative ent-kaurene synthase [Helianthus annuus]